MRTLETNDWMLLNTLIYKIYTIENQSSMRQQFLEQLKMLIDFDSADFYLPSINGDEHLENPVFLNCDQDMSKAYEEIEESRGILRGGRTLIYRETDIITDDARVDTEYYRKVYKPNNWHYSLQMVLARNKEFVGVVTFYRTIGKDNFEYDDIFVLDVLKEHLAYRLYQYKKNGNLLEDKITAGEAVEKYDLTRREHVVLKNLLAGKTNLDICSELTISENTLKKHIFNLYRKLGIKNRVQLFKMIREKE